MKVKEILFTKAPSVSKSDLALRARALMRQYNVRALPVFEDSKLIGVITRSDLIKITSSKSSITVGGLLWKALITLDANEDMLKAAKILLQEDLKQIPILENGKYIGMIRDVDILRAIFDSKVKSRKKTVGEVMTSRVRSFSVDDDIEKVWGAVKEHSGFPVTQKGKIVGIISTRELIESKRARIERESRATKKPAKVGHVMRIIIGEEERFLIHPSAPVEKAIKKMLDLELSVLPVAADHNKLVGIVTRKDLLKAYI